MDHQKGTRPLKIAVIQFCSGPDPAENMAAMSHLIEKAAKQNAQLVILPEMFATRGQPRDRLLENAQSIPGPITEQFSQMAQTQKIWIAAGSIAEKINHSTQVANTCAIINDTGQLIAKYQKIHLFDSQVPGASIKESDFYIAGNQLVSFQIGAIKIGVAICFDLRFPDQFQAYAKSGVHLFIVPSNFTAQTGQAHWEILLRARAIENLAYVAAPNQYGSAMDSIPAFGHSMIIDPWGQVMASAPHPREEIIYASIDINHVNECRKQLPVL